MLTLVAETDNSRKKYESRGNDGKKKFTIQRARLAGKFAVANNWELQRDIAQQ